MSSTIYYNAISYTINHVNLSLGSKCPQTTIIHTKNTHKVIYLLYKLGCINNFVLHSKVKGRRLQKYVTFSIFFFKNTPFFKSLRLVSSPSKKHTVTYSGLRIIQQSLGASVLLISSVHGLITHEKALKLKIGGLIVAVLN